MHAIKVTIVALVCALAVNGTALAGAVSSDSDHGKNARRTND